MDNKSDEKNCNKPVAHYPYITGLIIASQPQQNFQTLQGYISLSLQFCGFFSLSQVGAAILGDTADREVWSKTISETNSVKFIS